MAIADDLLEQSRLLAQTGENQASLRRSVSTAYYAVFHLLIQDSAARWSGSESDKLGVERAYNHGSMKSISIQFKDATWTDWSGMKRKVPVELQHVAGALIMLQEQRHSADYDNYRRWSISEANALFLVAIKAFLDWQFIRSDSLAGSYLLAMLLGKSR